MIKWQVDKPFVFGSIQEYIIPTRDQEIIMKVERNSYIYESEEIGRLIVNGRYINASSDLFNNAWKSYCTNVGILTENEVGDTTGAGSGESNTIGDMPGGGEGLSGSKTGVELHVKNLKAGTDVTLDSDANSVTINAETKSLGSMSAPGEVLNGTPLGNTLRTKRLVAGTNVTLSSDSNSVTINSSGGGGGGTPATTVVSETSFGQAPVVGTDTEYARQDHTHGTPASPFVPNPATAVTGETSFGQSDAVGTSVNYARQDHTHGTPVTPVTKVNEITSGQGDITGALSLGAGANVTLNQAGNTITIASTGGSGGTPATTVVTETSFGQSDAVGSSTNYAREDHTHGTPAAPLVPNPATTVTSEAIFGQPQFVGSSTNYAREDHTHGTPSNPVTTLNAISGAVTLTGGTNVTLTQTGNDISIAASGGGSSIVQYQVDSTFGAEVTVLADGPGITYSRASNVGTFTIPAGVRLISFSARIPAAVKVGNSFVYDMGSGGVMGNNSASDRWIPHYVVCDEATGNQGYTTMAMNLSNFSQFTIQNLSSSSTDLITCGF